MTDPCGLFSREVSFWPYGLVFALAGMGATFLVYHVISIMITISRRVK